MSKLFYYVTVQAFDKIYAEKMPAVHPACTIVARIRFSKIEQGEHKIKIKVIDEDGKAIGPELEDTISIKVGDKEDSSVGNFILNIQGLRLENYGDYRIDLAIDGRQEASLPLEARKVPKKS
jgi:hypothetical protein